MINTFEPQEVYIAGHCAICGKELYYCMFYDTSIYKLYCPECLDKLVDDINNDSDQQTRKDSYVSN
jgi:hypothetical protein